VAARFVRKTRMTPFREMLYDAATCQGGTHLPPFETNFVAVAAT
jgi:hypothetical protein